MGHAGADGDGTMLTLHGLAANIPASDVILAFFVLWTLLDSNQ